MNHNAIVSREEWLNARKLLLAREKEFTRARDELSRQRREQPWVEIDKPYEFDSPTGKVTLAQLFSGRSQLFVKHFMMGPRAVHQCVGCSLEVDHVEGLLEHLENHDVTYAAVARAPIEEIEVVRKRMGWRFPWVSSYGSDFNRDYDVSFTKDEMAAGKVYYNYQDMEFPSEEAPGASVFYKDKTGDIFHTYSAYARGLDILVGTYNFLDLTPKGRDEAGLKHTMAWVRHHDKYVDEELVDLVLSASKGAAQ